MNITNIDMMRRCETQSSCLSQPELVGCALVVLSQFP